MKRSGFLRKAIPVRAILILAFAIVCSSAHAEKARLTSHKEMMTLLASIQVADNVLGQGRLHVVCIGRSVKGREIPLVIISDPGVPIEQTKRLFVICRQHGDEPASTEAMLALIQDLAFSLDEGTNDLLTKVSFFIVPMVNPDGADRHQRRNANRADLNRDWLSLHQPETRYVRAAIDAVLPEVIIDQHELSPRSNRSDFIQCAGPKSGAWPGVVEESIHIQNLVIGMLMTHHMEARNLQIADQNPARLAHRYFPIHGGTKTFLFETRQSGARAYYLDYRMRLHIVGTMTIAKYLADREDELSQRIVEWRNNREWMRLTSRSKKPSRSAE